MSASYAPEEKRQMYLCDTYLWVDTYSQQVLEVAYSSPAACDEVAVAAA